MMRRGIVAVLCAFAVAAWTVSAQADAQIERYAKSDGFMGMGAFESTTVSTTSATAQREETRLKFTGGFLSAIQKMAGVGDSIRIVRLDRDIVWTLDPEKKTYTEQPLTTKGERARPIPGHQPRQTGEKGEQSDWVVTRNEFKIEKTGTRKTINSFPCDEYLMTWLVESRNTKTGETAKSLMTDRFWTTPETAEIRAVQAEEQAYARAYLKKLNLEMSPAEAQQFLAGLTGLSEAEQQKALARVTAERAKVQGYTIASHVEWTTESSGGTGSGQAGGSGSGGGSPQDVARAMGELSKLFGGGGQSGGSSGSGGGAKSGQGGNAPIFSMYTEVKSIKVTPTAPARFEIPAGYTKK